MKRLGLWCWCMRLHASSHSRLWKWCREVTDKAHTVNSVARRRFHVCQCAAICDGAMPVWSMGPGSWTPITDVVLPNASTGVGGGGGAAAGLPRRIAAARSPRFRQRSAPPFHRRTRCSTHIGSSARTSRPWKHALCSRRHASPCQVEVLRSTSRTVVSERAPTSSGEREAGAAAGVAAGKLRRVVAVPVSHASASRRGANGSFGGPWPSPGPLSCPARTQPSAPCCSMPPLNSAVARGRSGNQKSLLLLGWNSCCLHRATALIPVVRCDCKLDQNASRRQGPCMRARCVVTQTGVVRSLQGRPALKESAFRGCSEGLRWESHGERVCAERVCGERQRAPNGPGSGRKPTRNRGYTNTTLRFAAAAIQGAPVPITTRSPCRRGTHRCLQRRNLALASPQRDSTLKTIHGFVYLYFRSTTPTIHAHGQPSARALSATVLLSSVMASRHRCKGSP